MNEQQSDIIHEYECKHDPECKFADAEQILQELLQNVSFAFTVDEKSHANNELFQYLCDNKELLVHLENPNNNPSVMKMLSCKLIKCKNSCMTSAKVSYLMTQIEIDNTFELDFFEQKIHELCSDVELSTYMRLSNMSVLYLYLRSHNYILFDKFQKALTDELKSHNLPSKILLKIISHDDRICDHNSTDIPDSHPFCTQNQIKERYMIEYVSKRTQELQERQRKRKRHREIERKREIELRKQLQVCTIL